MYTTTEAADLIGVKYYQLTYLLRTHRELDVPRCNYRRVFSPDDVLALAKAFNVSGEKIAVLASKLSGTAKPEPTGEQCNNI